MAYTGSFSFGGGYETPDNDPDYVYYNATIINNRTDVLAVDTRDPQVRFQETRSIPIIKDASKYNFSIIRFTMSGPNKDLPLFIPVIRTGASNPTNDVNLTIYSITLTATIGGTTYTSGAVPIMYAPETLDPALAPVPDPLTIASGIQDLNTRYYWVYTYGHFLDLVNAAFATAHANIIAQQASAVGVPYMTYDPTTNLFSLLTDSAGFGKDHTGPERWEVYFNSDMFGLFTNFNNYYVNGDPTAVPAPYGPVAITPLTAPLPEATNLIVIESLANQNVVNVAFPGAAANYWWKTTQYCESTSSIWSPIESIVFTSALLPLVNEQTGDPVQFGQSNLGLEQQNTQSAFQPIITDIALPLANACEYRQYIQYAPTAEYRLASFQRSRQPINNIDIQVFWKNRLDGNLYPVNMFNSSSVTVKIMFRRRGIFDYPHPAKGGLDI